MTNPLVQFILWLISLFSPSEPRSEMDATPRFDQPRLVPRETDEEYSEPSESDQLEPLTDRELEIGRLILDGVPRKEITRRLGIKPNTLKSHCANIYYKLGIHKQSELPSHRHRFD